MSKLRPLMEKNFIEYASYVIVDRAIPDIKDGCKPVQRRILHTLFGMHDGTFHKVANVIGETMKLHPHGDISIADALVLLANKEYFIEKQGNFGNVLTGHNAAASRYIECRLTPLAVETLFNSALTRYGASYDGRKKEPVNLPAKIPVLLMLGTEGIAVGLSTRILPHNFIELLEAQIKILNGQTVAVLPDFPQGGFLDATEYDDGRGRVRVRALIEKVDPKRLFVREPPFGTTTSSLIASIEAAVQKGRVNVGSINDYTTDKVEIEINMPRGVTAEQVLPQLFAYTDCEVSISSNIVAIKDNRPVEISVSEYLKESTLFLKKLIKGELENELEKLEERRHRLTLEQLFVEKRVYKRLESKRTETGIKKAVRDGMKPYEDKFLRKMTDDDVRRLLELRIRRISAYDMTKNRDEMGQIAEAIRLCRVKLRSLKKTTIGYIRGLIETYGKEFPRRTQLSTFKTVDKRTVARANIKLSYNKETGLFGSNVRSQDMQMTVSEYDRILAVTSDGTYRVLAPPEKIWLPGKLLYCAPFDSKKGATLTYIYRDNRKITWGKKIRIERFITDRVYEMLKEGSGGIDFLSYREKPVVVKLHFVPTPRQKLKTALVDTKTIKPCGLSSRGVRLHPKPVSKVTPVPRTKKSKTRSK
jgi:topoisomerase-4 subunit A